jgi:hypothetical protein
MSKSTSLKVITIGLVMLLTVTAVSACSSDKLRFHEIDVDKTRIGFASDSPVPDIFILSDTNTSMSSNLYEPYWREVLRPVDFSKYFLVFVFGKPGSHNDIVEVKNVRQDGGTITVTARFYTLNWTSVPAEIVSPAQAIKVSKANMKSFGRITFKLSDTTGLEKASTIATILSP